MYTLVLYSRTFRSELRRRNAVLGLRLPGDPRRTPHLPLAACGVRYGQRLGDRLLLRQGVARRPGVLEGRRAELRTHRGDVVGKAHAGGKRLSPAPHLVQGV